MPKFTLRYARPDEAAIRTLSFEAENFARAMEMVREADAMPVSLVEDRFWQGTWHTPERWIGRVGPLVLLLVVVLTTSKITSGAALFQMVFNALVVLIWTLGVRRKFAKQVRRNEGGGLRPLIDEGATTVEPVSAWAQMIFLALFVCYTIFTIVLVVREPTNNLTLLYVSGVMLICGMFAMGPITHRPFPPDLDDPAAAARSS